MYDEFSFIEIKIDTVILAAMVNKDPGVKVLNAAIWIHQFMATLEERISFYLDSIKDCLDRV